nr:MAG TPA: hypothetical protein [Caudoviricetes sp.]
MTKEERRLIKIVCEEAFTDEAENPYDICVSLSDCYKSFSKAKEEAYFNCERNFSANINDLFNNVDPYKILTFTRILSHNQSIFTLLQGAYFFSRSGALVALFRLDTKARVMIRGFVLEKMSHDLITMKKSFFEIKKMIETNK